MHNNVIKGVGYIAALMVLSLGANAAMAASTWVGPTATPPGENADGPITIGSLAQTKAGPLSIRGVLDADGFAVFGESYFGDSLQIEDGTQAAGFVLASDADGNASWTDIDSLIDGTVDTGGGNGGDTGTTGASGVCYEATVQAGGSTVLSAPGCLDGLGLCALSLSRSGAGDWSGGNAHVTALYMGKPNGYWERLSSTGSQAVASHGNSSDAAVSRFLDQAGSCFLDEAGAPGTFRLTGIPASVTPCSALACPVN